MKVNIIVEPALKEDFVEIHVREISNEITQLGEFFKKKSPVITGIDNYEQIKIIDETDIVSIHAEKKWCRIYTDMENYSCRKRLFEIENMLGEDFMRISKSIVVNLRKIESVQAVFNGMLLLVMQNGSKEYVSRTYLRKMKEYLGL